MTTIQDVRAAGANFGRKFKKSRTYMPGTLGDGNGNVLGTRNNMVMVRVGNNPPTEVFNFRVPPIDELPVLVGYDSDQPDTNNVMEIIGVDRSRIVDWQNFTYVPLHAHSHSYGDPEAPYEDVPTIHKHQFKPMLVGPTSPSSMAVEIQADYYLFRNEVAYFPKTTAAELTAYKPAEEWAAVVVLIYISLVTGELSYLRGTEFNRIFPPSISEQVPAPPINSVPLAGVLLYSSTTSIEEQNIVDIRLMVNSVEDLGTHPAMEEKSSRSWMGV